MKQFVVGKTYEACDCSVDPITVFKRTEKMITVGRSKDHTWRMRIKTDADGNEYVTDSFVPLKWREMYTFKAIWEVEEIKQYQEFIYNFDNEYNCDNCPENHNFDSWGGNLPCGQQNCWVTCHCKIEE